MTINNILRLQQQQQVQKLQQLNDKMIQSCIFLYNDISNMTSAVTVVSLALTIIICHCSLSRGMQNFQQSQANYEIDHSFQFKSGVRRLELFFSPDHYYHLIAKIGTPEQSLKLRIDSLSCDIFIMVLGCENCDENTPKFDIQKSQSLIILQNHDHYRITSTYFTISGQYAKDQVTIQDIQVDSQFFLVINLKKTIVPNKENLQGAIGLCSNKQDKNIFQLLHEQQMSVSSLFALQLQIPQFMIEGSYLYYNFTKQQFPEVKYFKKDTQSNNWQFKAPVVLVRGRKYLLDKFIFDFIAQSTFAPAWMLNKIYNQTMWKFCEMDTQITCQANSLSKLPNITIEFNKNERLDLTPQMYLAFNQSTNNYKFKLKAQTSLSSDISLGMDMLRYFTVIFDKENGQVGFVQRKNPIKLYILQQSVLFVFNCLCIISLILIVLAFIKIMRLQRTSPLKVSMKNQFVPDSSIKSNQIQLQVRKNKNQKQDLANKQINQQIN